MKAIDYDIKALRQLIDDRRSRVFKLREEQYENSNSYNKYLDRENDYESELEIIDQFLDIVKKYRRYL